MNVALILGLVEKGLNVAQTLLESGKDAKPAFDALRNLFSDKKEITDQDLEATEKVLDELIAEFNEPLE